MTATPQAASDLSASPVSPSAGSSGGQSHRSGGLRPARPLLTYLWLDLYRSLREPANLFFVVAFPLAMYLVFGRLNASAGDYGPHAHGNVSASVMLAMASFSACLGATSASAAAAVEQSAGWGRQMAVTSRGLSGYLVVKTGTAVGTAALPVIVVLAAGALTDSQMEGWVWAVSALICLIGAGRRDVVTVLGIDRYRDLPGLPVRLHRQHLHAAEPHAPDDRSLHPNVRVDGAGPVAAGRGVDLRTGSAGGRSGPVVDAIG